MSSTPTSRARRAAAALALVLGSVVAALAIAEAALRFLRPLPDPFARAKLGEEPQRYIPWAHAPNLSLEFVAEPGLPGMSGKTRFTTNALGFRGPPIAVPKEPGELRIFLVGGSTMECILVDDAASPERVMQGLLEGRLPGRKVRVYNAGRSGDRSFDHVALVAHRIAHLEPDLIVVFAGANDLRAAMYHADYLHQARGQRVRHSLPALVKHVATEFQVARLVYAAAHRTGMGERERLERIAQVSDYRQKVALKQGKPVSGEPPRTDIAPYGRNLASLAGIARAQGAAVVFVTQASTWNTGPEAERWHWMNHVADRVYPEPLMEQALEAYNAEMRRVAGEHGVAVLDAARLIPRTLDHFYDDMHFNTRGAGAFGKMLADFVVEKKIVGR